MTEQDNSLQWSPGCNGKDSHVMTTSLAALEFLVTPARLWTWLVARLPDATSRPVLCSTRMTR